MRALLALLVLLALLPLAAAKPNVPDPTHGHVEAGPCAAGWSLYWPGELAGAACAGNGASVGTLALGDYVCAYANYKPVCVTL